MCVESPGNAPKLLAGLRHRRLSDRPAEEGRLRARVAAGRVSVGPTRPFFEKKKIVFFFAVQRGLARLRRALRKGLFPGAEDPRKRVSVSRKFGSPNGRKSIAIWGERRERPLESRVARKNSGIAAESVEGSSSTGARKGDSSGKSQRSFRRELLPRISKSRFVFFKKAF